MLFGKPAQVILIYTPDRKSVPGISLDLNNYLLKLSFINFRLFAVSIIVTLPPAAFYRLVL